MPYIQADGATIYYDISGQGEPLVLLMGLGVDRRGWMMQLPAFKNYSLITPDNRGVGQSSSTETHWTIEAMAQDALAVLEAEGLEKAHVAGISMGGMIAQAMALQAPEKVHTLTLAATLPAPGPYEQNLFKTLFKQLTGHEEILPETLTTQQVSLDELITFTLPLNFTPGFLKDNKPLIRGMMEMLSGGMPDFAGYARQFLAIQGYDSRARLGEIRCPTLVIKPAKDQLLNPSHSDELAAGIPGAQLAVMPDAPHACNVEGVDMFNSLILGFLAAHPMA